jgi:hypothetical protein
MYQKDAQSQSNGAARKGGRQVNPPVFSRPLEAVCGAK